jgi:hypothetical protein
MITQGQYQTHQSLIHKIETRAKEIAIIILKVRDRDYDLKCFMKRNMNYDFDFDVHQNSITVSWDQWIGECETIYVSFPDYYMWTPDGEISDLEFDEFELAKQKHIDEQEADRVKCEANEKARRRILLGELQEEFKDEGLDNE